MRKKKPLIDKIESRISFHQKKIEKLNEKLADIKKVGFKYLKNENTL